MEAKSLADTKWFDLFHDDTLTRLVDTALKQNFDLQIAAERVLEARAQLGVIQAARLPNIDATGGFNLNRGSRIGANRVRSREYQPGFELYAGGIFAGLGTGCLGARPAAQ